MPFRTFIYLDKEKVDEYLLVLDEQQSNKKSKVSVRARANFVIGEVEADLEKRAEDKRSRTAAEQYNLFENALSNTTEDDYFDFLSSDYDMSTVPPLSIIRCTGYIEIPEAFDMLHMVSEFAGPMINLKILKTKRCSLFVKYTPIFLTKRSSSLILLRIFSSSTGLLVEGWAKLQAT